jgi:hypothetical protein
VTNGLRVASTSGEAPLKKHPRDVPHDIDPAPEPDGPNTRPSPRPIDGTAESLYTAERRYDPRDEHLGHTGELSRPQGRADVENRVTRRRDGAPKPQVDGDSYMPLKK